MTYLNTTADTVKSKKARHHYLDWLRSLAILMLIFFHSGMPFVPWGFHIKNPETSPIFEWWMSPMHDFRMPLLFFIAGAVTHFSLKNRSNKAFASERLCRLGWPIVFAVFIVVPPQLWAERVTQGEVYESVFDFYNTIYEFVPYPQGNLSWHHLWFVAYLLVYGLLGALVFKRDNVIYQLIYRWVKFGVSSRWALLSLCAPLLATEWFLKPFYPETHALIGDWATLLFYGTLYLLGYLLIQLDDFTELCSVHRRFFLIIAICLTGTRFIGMFLEIGHPITNALDPVFTWATVLAIVAYGMKYLNIKNGLSVYLSKSSYCVYIVHQTWIVLLTYWLLPHPLSISAKFWVVALVTLILSFLSYEILKRVPLVRIGFGIK